MSEYFLDLQGLPCPLPLVKLKKALVTQQNMKTFNIVATDKGVLKDIPAFCKVQNLTCEIQKNDSPFELKVSRQAGHIVNGRAL